MKRSVLFILFLVVSAGTCYADLLDTARGLLLSGQREKSYELLINGLSSKNNKVKNLAIKKELENLSNVFVSELGQKNYQQAKTLFYTKDEGFKAKLQAAESLEPKNLKIKYTKAWFFLIEKKCSKAEAEFTKIKKLNIQYEGLPRLDFYIKQCDMQPDAECGGLNYNTREKKKDKILKLARCRKKSEGSAKLKTYCKLIKIDAPTLPEVTLWCSLAVDKFVKYKERCKELSEKSRQRELLELYPFVCDKKLSSQLIKD